LTLHTLKARNTSRISTLKAIAQRFRCQAEKPKKCPQNPERFYCSSIKTDAATAGLLQKSAKKVTKIKKNAIGRVFTLKKRFAGAKNRTAE